MDWSKYGFETRAIHAGQEPDPTTGAVMTPIYLTSTFAQSSPGVHKGYDYSRAGNPTRQAYEDCLASLENGQFGLAFASGCSAMAAIVQLLKVGDHVICSDDVYGGTFRLFDKVLRRFQLDFTFADTTVLFGENDSGRTSIIEALLLSPEVGCGRGSRLGLPSQRH